MCVSVYWQTNLSVCVCVGICMGVRQSGQTLSEARPTQQAMRVKRIICQYVRSFRICTASPVASCQFNYRHHHHPSSETVPGPPTVPQATLLRWPFVRVSAVDVVVAVANDVVVVVVVVLIVIVVVVVCRAHKFFVPAAYSIARSVNILLTG